MRYLDPKNDPTFKKIFCEHPDILMDLLNSLEAAQKELALANEQLAIANKELTAANEQLAIANKELTSANEQLAIAEQKAAEERQQKINTAKMLLTNGVSKEIIAMSYGFSVEELEKWLE
jgi:chromosome segregation ATPase